MKRPNVSWAQKALVVSFAESYFSARIGMAQLISPDEDLESSVRLDMSSFPKSTPWPSFGVLRRWYHVSVLRILVMEFRNLLCHIRFSLETYELESRGQTGLIRLGLRRSFSLSSKL
jgi:hypothetical protein